MGYILSMYVPACFLPLVTLCSSLNIVSTWHRDSKSEQDPLVLHSPQDGTLPLCLSFEEGLLGADGTLWWCPMGTLDLAHFVGPCGRCCQADGEVTLPHHEPGSLWGTATE